MTAYRTDHIALLVHDLDEELAFLIGVLGLTEGTNPMGGIAGPSCGNWLATADTGTVGLVDWAVSAQWTDAAVRGCDQFNHLYCFEQ